MVELPGLVILVALVEYMFFALKVGANRQKYNVVAPAVSGHEEWERYYRVQQNTLEQLIVFIPSLWFFAMFVSPLIGAGIGLAFVVGRAIYYTSYIKDPGSRGAGFGIGFLANVALVLGAAGGAIYNLAVG